MPILRRIHILILLCLLKIGAEVTTSIVDSANLGTVEVLSYDGEVAYTHDKGGKLLDTILDSFAVVVEVEGQESDSTYVFVQLIPAFELKLITYPHSLRIKQGLVPQVDRKTSNFFQLHETSAPDRGEVIALRGPQKADNLFGSYSVFDPTGNIIVHRQPMVWVTLDNGSQSLVHIWDGRNQYGKLVSTGTYLIVVRATIEIDGASDSRSFRNTVLVYAE